MNEKFIGYYNSPIGILEIKANSLGITELNFTDNETTSIYNDVIKNCLCQLEEYFNGTRSKFDISISFEKGTEFQHQVWNTLMKIPYGKTASYKEVALLIENEKAVRAVGNANNKNPIPIIIPCHRVIGSNGKLVGYAGELWRKEWLLNHEKKCAK